jgi:hypothetical protein
MPVRVCLHCGLLHPLGQTCPNLTGNTSWNGTRDRATQAAFRKRVLKAAGNRCQAVTNGHRCTMTTNLHAHHIDQYTGVALCRTHHRQADRHAR